MHDEGWYAEHDIELRTGTTVDRRSTRPRATSTLDGGERLGYDRLLLATGAEPRRLPVPGARARRRPLPAHVRRQPTALARGARARRRASSSSAPAGSGWRSRPRPASTAPRSRSSSRRRAAAARARPRGRRRSSRDLHREHGVELLTGAARRARSRATAASSACVLADGRALDCRPASSSASASMPRTELAERGRARGRQRRPRRRAACRPAHPDVFAAGDVANADHPFYGRRVRVEHWANALNQGPGRGRRCSASPRPTTGCPYFFSDQYDLGMEYRGLATAPTTRRDPRRRRRRASSSPSGCASGRVARRP